jgi:flavin-dependent dehydrogenase
VTERSTDAVIIGGGLAGLTAALHLEGAGVGVTVIEKRSYPQHKICGEYVSNEILPYFDRLRIPVRAWQPQQVHRLRLHASSGRWLESRLALGGFGLRRQTLEHELYRLARDRGVRFELDTTVRDVTFRDDRVHVHSADGAEWAARAVLGAFGKRSEVDRSLARGFLRRPAAHVGVKFYVRAPFPSDLVALYGFDGGYAGAVKVEDGTVDVAYLTTDWHLKAHAGLDAFEERVLFANHALRELLASSTRLSARPLAISNVSFRAKEQVHRHVLMVGDAAGMILPLCGNGMAMAVHGAKLAAEAVVPFLEGRVDRAEMERGFRRAWRARFARRLFWGRCLSPLVESPQLCELAVGALRRMPALLPPIIARTHGNAFA